MGVRGRIALSISLLTALAVVVLGLTVHHYSETDRESRSLSLQAARLRSALQVYNHSGTLTLGAKLNDPALPASLKKTAKSGSFATYLSSGDDARAWAATSVGDGSTLSVSAVFRIHDPAQQAVDRAL